MTRQPLRTLSEAEMHRLVEMSNENLVDLFGIHSAYVEIKKQNESDKFDNTLYHLRNELLRRLEK